jgi:UDP-N-acetylmuramoyl-tripeptide--D-alanyl-D-alanine ligase
VVRADKAGRLTGPKVVVADTLTALMDLARWHRQRQDLLVVGVTGSVGKTTTREMIHAALAAGFAGTRSPRNFNNHVGLPLSILEIERRHEFAVLELGASAVGEIRDLAAVAQPEIGTVTAIALAHYEKFGGERQILEAKGELIEMLPESGVAVLPGDCPLVRSLAGRARSRVIHVGESDGNHVKATHVSTDFNRLRFRVEKTTYELPVTGRHHLTAALIAVAIGREVGMTPAAIAAGLREFQPVAGRCRIEQIGRWTVIDDTYNANPGSMQAACDVLRDWKGTGKRILVAGDMLELGNKTIECHRELGRAAAAAGIDHLIVHGPSARQTIRGARDGGLSSYQLAECDSLEAAFTVLDCWLEAGDVVLVKGSRGMRMERVIDWLREQQRHTLQETTARAVARACA